MKAWFLGFLVMAIAGTAVVWLGHWEITRDIEGWKVRAQVSSEPNDMVIYLKNVRAGMEKHGMTEGYAAFIFSAPDNDMSLIYHTVQQHVRQAEVLTTMDRRSPEYQTGLDNLRGSIRELDLKASKYWDVRHGGLYWVMAIAGWGFVLFAVLAVIIPNRY